MTSYTPRDGVMWAAKYSSSGMRHFSALGPDSSLNPETPPWARRVPPVSSVPFSFQSVFLEACSGRAKSAPAQSTRSRRDKRKTRSDDGKPSDTLDREFKSGSMCSPDSVGSVSADSTPRDDQERQTRSASTSRARNAWGRLVARMKPGCVPDPQPKPTWGEMISRAKARLPPPGCPSTSSAPFSPTSRATDPQSSASSLASPSSSSTSSPSATPKPDSSRQSSPARRAVSFTKSAQECTVECVVGNDEGEEEAELVVLVDSGDNLDEDETVTNAHEGIEAGSSRSASAMSAMRWDLESAYSAEARKGHYNGKPSPPPQWGVKENKHTLVQVHFAKEYWYRKGVKMLAAKRAEEAKRVTKKYRDSDDEENDVELVLQRLSRPTASSRSRQVTHMPVPYTPPPSSRRGPNSLLGADSVRFKGKRNVSSGELSEIVERLSACDPAKVTESGRSRFKGKGFCYNSGAFFRQSRSRSRSSRKMTADVETSVRQIRQEA